MNLKNYQEKKNEAHTPEEIKEAFDTSFAVYFSIKREKLKGILDK